MRGATEKEKRRWMDKTRVREGKGRQMHKLRWKDENRKAKIVSVWSEGRWHSAVWQAARWRG